MKMIDYLTIPKTLTDKSEFTEASREELRVLLALIEANGRFSSEEELAKKAATSKARAVSSLVFWEEAGVITPREKGAEAIENLTRPTITEEFEERIELGEISEESAVKVAKDIRDNGLSELLNECALIMEKPTLSTAEAKQICAIYTQYALGEEYIITLAAYIAQKGKLTAQRLVIEAERLVKRGIDCVEALEKYIIEKDKESGAGWEFKHLLGIYNRNLSKSEQEYVNKWYYEYGFSEEIIGIAFDITVVNTAGKVSLPYMDKLLTHWNECGCKTADDCNNLIERERTEKKVSEKAEEKVKKASAPKKQTPRYGDFDVNDAFKKALQRSYGDKK